MSSTVDPKVIWATRHVFDNPHSVTLHESSGLLVVADREHASIKLLDSEDGDILGAWNCGLRFGNNDGLPFGVRALYFDGVDMLFVASMDNPQDHKHQRIHVLDVSKLDRTEGTSSPCRILQTIDIDANVYSGPHLLGVDPENGDLYVALVADEPRSTVLRYSIRKSDRTITYL